jgi:hypothetical protein
MIENEVSNTEHVAAMLSGNATTNSVSAVKVVAYRVPMHLLGPVDAMSKKAGKSRNAMLNLLVRVGIDEVRKQLSDDAAEALTLAESEAYSLLLGDASPTETLEE